MSSDGTFMVSAPQPLDKSTEARWEQQRLRRRILEGAWASDLMDLYIIAMGPVKARQHTDGVKVLLDQTSNLLRSYSSAQATLYDRLTTWDHEDVFAAQVVSEVLRIAGHDSLMQRLQRDTIAVREGVLSVDVYPVLGEVPSIVLRTVPSDLIELWAAPQAPDTPVRAREALPRQVNGRWEWVYQETSIDPNEAGAPYRRIVDSRGADVSAQFLVDGDGNPAPKGGFQGDSYPEQDADGAWLPYVLYHAQRTSKLWDWTEGLELVNSTLITSVLWTFWHHIMRQASFPQRVLIDGQASGSDEVEGQREVIGDPSNVLLIETSKRITEGGLGGTAKIDQWLPGADPEKIQNAIALYERRVAGMAGISPSDIQRVAGDPRSGYALALNQNAQREAQRQFRPSFSRGDRLLASIVARSIKKHTGLDLPSGGYSPVYGGIPLSGDELQAVTKVVLELRAAGLMTQRQALRTLYPDLTDVQLDRLTKELESQNTGHLDDDPDKEDTP